MAEHPDIPVTGMEEIQAEMENGPPVINDEDIEECNISIEFFFIHKQCIKIVL